MLVACPSCQRQTMAKFPLCQFCSGPLAPPSKCPDCGHDVPAGLRACKYCGATVAPKATPAAPSKPPTPPPAPAAMAAHLPRPASPAPVPRATRAADPPAALRASAPTSRSSSAPERTRGLPGVACVALGLVLLAVRGYDTAIPGSPGPVTLEDLGPRTGWQHVRLANGSIDPERRWYRARTADGPVLSRNDPRAPIVVAGAAELFARREELRGSIVTLQVAPASPPLWFHHADGSVTGVRGPATPTKSTKILACLHPEGRVWAFSTRFESADAPEAQAFLAAPSITGFVSSGVGQWANMDKAYARMGGQLPEEAVTVQVLPDLDTSDLEVWAPISSTTTFAAARGGQPPAPGTPLQGVYRRTWGTADDPAFFSASAGAERPTGVLVLGDPSDFLAHLGVSRWQPFGLALLLSGLLIGGTVATLSAQAAQEKHSPRRWAWVMDLHVALALAAIATAWQVHEHQGSLWALLYGAGALMLALADAVVFAAYKNPIALACRHAPILRALLGSLTVLIGLATLALALVPLLLHGRGLGRLMRSFTLAAFMVAYGAAAAYYGVWILFDPEAAVD